MAGQPSENTALISIKPEFAWKIFTGEKRVEFRKTRPKASISHMLVYATNPVKKIVGVFEINRVTEATPVEIWEAYEDVAGIDRCFFDEYYSRSDKAVAIEVGNYREFEIPMNYSSLGINGSPPQSYRYLSSEVMKTLV